MGSPGDEHSAPPEPPQSDLPPSSGFGIALIGLAWLSCVIGMGYTLVYMIGMGMSPTSRGPSASEAIAVSVWFMISAVAILTHLKRHRPGAGSMILLALPGAVTALGLLFALPGLMGNPLAALLILIIPAAAAVYDFASHTEQRSGWALEAVLLASLILTPAWILMNGLSQRNLEVAQYHQRAAREALFTSIMPSLKAMLPKEVGTWRLVESMSPKDDPSGMSKFAQEARRTSIHPWELYALYEDSAAQPYDPALAQELFEKHTKEVATRLVEVSQELEATNGNDTPNGMSDERFHLRQGLENKQAWLRLQQKEWNADTWRKWDQKENVIEVRIQLWAPGEVVSNGMSVTTAKLPAAPPGVILPWNDPLHVLNGFDFGLRESCTLGQCSQTPQAKALVRGSSAEPVTFLFTSLGIVVDAQGNNAGRMDQFVKGFDLSHLVDITRKTPVTSLQVH